MLVHELGHAFFQILFGHHVEKIEWGAGPVIVRFGKLEIRLVPFVGSVKPIGCLLTPSRWKGFFIAVGGVVFQWMGVYLIAKAAIYKLPYLDVFSCTYFICALLGCTQLVPVRPRDGYYALQSLKGEYSTKRKEQEK